MSDHSQTIVDIDATEVEAPALAERVRSWLVSEGVIEADVSDCVLGGDGGHRPSRNVRLAVGNATSPPLQTNGLEIRVGRSVFDAGENGIELECARCHHVFEPDESWFEAVGAWSEGDDAANMACPACRHATRLPEWTGPWTWGFGQLGFTFWNWPPLSETFVASMREKLGHRVVLVKTHI